MREIFFDLLHVAHQKRLLLLETEHENAPRSRFVQVKGGVPQELARSFVVTISSSEDQALSPGVRQQDHAAIVVEPLLAGFHHVGKDIHRSGSSADGMADLAGQDRVVVVHLDLADQLMGRVEQAAQARDHVLLVEPKAERGEERQDRERARQHLGTAGKGSMHDRQDNQREEECGRIVAHSPKPVCSGRAPGDDVPAGSSASEDALRVLDLRRATSEQEGNGFEKTHAILALIGLLLHVLFKGGGDFDPVRAQAPRCKS